MCRGHTSEVLDEASWGANRVQRSGPGLHSPLQRLRTRRCPGRWVSWDGDRVLEEGEVPSVKSS